MQAAKFIGTAVITMAAAMTSATAVAAVEISSFEAEVLKLVNIERAKVGASALQFDLRLQSAAEVHSIDMASNNCFQHESCDGTPTFTRIFSYYPSGSWAAENIAAGYATPKSVVDGWMNSAGHKANILNSVYQGIGIGHYYLAGSTWGNYWTQDFGSLPIVPMPVPEPESYAMLLAGLGLMGVLARRRKQQS